VDQPEERELRERVGRLENDIAEIKKVLGQLTSQPLPPPGQPSRIKPVPKIPTLPPKPPTSSSWKLPANMRGGDFWLKIVGIGLTLFGVAFAFKYSIDQGWINPLVRHLFGLGVGMILLLFGLHLYGRRPAFGQVLLGGSIGTFYITCFSAFQLFELITYPVAFAGMVAISVGSFVIALRQDRAFFSVIGTAGALGTPFLLYTGSGNLPGLVLYTCLVFVSAAAVYFYKGWRLLLWLSAIGGWIVLAIGVIDLEMDSWTVVDGDRWAMQAGLVTAWLTFWITPVARRVAAVKAPTRWRIERLGIGDSGIGSMAQTVLDRHVHLLSVGPVLLALMLSYATWSNIDPHVIGWVNMAVVPIYALAAVYLKTIPSLRDLSFTQAAVGIVLFTLALINLLSGDTLRFVLSSEALTLLVIGRHLSDRRVSLGGHLLFAAVVIGLWSRLIVDPSGALGFFSEANLVDLWTIACVGAAAFVWNEPDTRWIYVIVAALSLARLLGREFEGNLHLFLVTLEAAVLSVLAWRLKDVVLRVFSHVFWLGTAVFVASRMAEPRLVGPAFFNPDAAFNLLPLILIAGTTFLLANEAEKRTYLLAAHVGFLAWLARELLPLENGQGYISVAWGVFGAILLITGLRRNVHLARLVGLGTLMLVVAKMFVVDLARIETIWRVLLFIGFGGVFLALSYYFPKLWKKNAGESSSDKT